MKRVCVVGHFGFGLNMLNGQTIKTKNVTSELELVLGEEQVSKIDTHGGIKSFPFILLKLFIAFCTCKNICIFPAHNGVKIFVPVCVILNAVFKRKVHYIVIGGWLPSFIEDKPRLEKYLKKLDGIYVETSVMKRRLEERGFTNIVLFPNFKRINILNENELCYSHSEPYKVCTFSRVMKEKGIEDAVNVVRQINETEGRTVYTLDIYGQVDSEQIEWFDELQRTFPDYIQYKGVVDSEKSVEVLKDYFLLLFPTRFYTEGIPGTILDAYAAGVPVVAARWESFEDVVDEQSTGLGYIIYNIVELKEILKTVSTNSFIIYNMKTQCLQYATAFSPICIIKGLFERFL